VAEAIVTAVPFEENIRINGRIVVVILEANVAEVGEHGVAEGEIREAAEEVIILSAVRIGTAHR